jgi:DNA-binding response OmpR family regulator
MKILAIEDQEQLAEFLKKGLKHNGFSLDYVTDGESGQKRIELYHDDYNLVLLDLMLPKRNGLEVCKNVRDLGITVPIIILTAKDNINDKVALFEAGADDYLVKPFSFKELIARINAVLRRPQKSYVKELKVGDLTINPKSLKAFYKDKELKLTLKEISILEYLMQNPNQVVSREQLLMNNWDFNSDQFNNVIDVYMNRLRNKIDGDRHKDIIETVRGVGYRLNG